MPADKPAPNRLDVDLTIAADARVGVHRVGVVTPLGVPEFVPFAVEAHPAATETEPNDDPAAVKPVALPATLVGTIDKPGDVDHFRFEAKEGRATRLRDDGQGARVEAPGRADPARRPGPDDRRGRRRRRRPGPDRRPSRPTGFTRCGSPTPITAARASISTGSAPARRPYVDSASSRSASRPARRRTFGSSALNLRGVGEVTVSPAPGTEPGTIVEVPVALGGRLAADQRADGRRLRRAAVGRERAERRAGEGRDGRGARAASRRRIGRDGDVDHFRFAAKKGERLIVEVFGRRLGTPIDPVIEILDAQGPTRPPRRAQAGGRDRGRLPRPQLDASPGIRLTRWNNLAINDTVLFGREVARIFALPRNPDDDCQFWAEQGPAGRLPGNDPRASPDGPADLQGRGPPARHDLPPGRRAAGHARLPQRRRRPVVQQGLPAHLRPARRRRIRRAGGRRPRPRAARRSAITWSSAAPGPISGSR